MHMEGSVETAATQDAAQGRHAWSTCTAPEPGPKHSLQLGRVLCEPCGGVCALPGYALLAHGCAKPAHVCALPGCAMLVQVCAKPAHVCALLGCGGGLLAPATTFLNVLNHGEQLLPPVSKLLQQRWVPSPSSSRTLGQRRSTRRRW